MLENGYKTERKLTPREYSYKTSKTPTMQLSISTASPNPIKNELKKMVMKKEEKIRDLGKYNSLFKGLGEYSLLNSFQTKEQINGAIINNNLVLGLNSQNIKFFVEINKCNTECRNSSLTPVLNSIQVEDSKNVIDTMCTMIESSGIFLFYPKIGILMKNPSGIVYRVFTNGKDFFSSVYQESNESILDINPDEYYVVILSEHLDQVIVDNKMSSMTDIDEEPYIPEETVNVISLEISRYKFLLDLTEKDMHVNMAIKRMNELRDNLMSNKERLAKSTSLAITSELVESQGVIDKIHRLLSCLNQKMM